MAFLLEGTHLTFSFQPFGPNFFCLHLANILVVIVEQYSTTEILCFFLEQEQKAPDSSTFAFQCPCGYCCRTTFHCRQLTQCFTYYNDSAVMLWLWALLVPSDSLQTSWIFMDSFTFLVLLQLKYQWIYIGWATVINDLAKWLKC